MVLFVYRCKERPQNDASDEGEEKTRSDHKKREMMYKYEKPGKEGPKKRDLDAL